MGWTYEEYLDQPAWFTTMLFELFRAEADRARRNVK